jgi:hypothetical protein
MERGDADISVDLAAFCGISPAAAGVTRLAGWGMRIRTFVWLNQISSPEVMLSRVKKFLAKHAPAGA